jgi:DNA-binding MarR family transcriptional regulator
LEGSVDRLVNTSKHILRLLYDGGTNANQIIKQTSSDRSYVFNVLEALQEEGLISESPDTKKHKQRKIKNLTELGREIAEIIKLVQSCYESCDVLKQEKKTLDFKLIRVPPENYLIRLQNMEPDGKNAIGIYILNYVAADYVRDFVIFKYVILLRKRDVRKKKITSQIFEQNISDATKRQMDAIKDGIFWIGDPSEFIAEFGEHTTKIANLPEKMWRSGLLSNKFSGKEKAKEALLSVLPILKSERESILQSMGGLDVLTEMQKQIHELKLKLDLEKGKPHPKEDPSERERDALYHEIRKTLN